MRRAKHLQVALLTAVLIALLISSVVLGLLDVPQSPEGTRMLLGLTLAFALAGASSIRLPRGDDVSIGTMIAVYAVAVGGAGPAILAAMLAGLIAVVLGFARTGRDSTVVRIVDSLRSVVLVALLSVCCSQVPPPLHSAIDDQAIVWALLAGIAYAMADLLLLALLQRLGGGSSVAHGFFALARSLGVVYIVHVSLAGVAVRLIAIPGEWAFPVALLLTLILQNSFNLYMRIRRAYADTIGTLARAAELDRPCDAGRSQRVSDLAVTVGRLMGLAGRELERVSFAAMLYDIGRIGNRGDESDDECARRGMRIVASIPFLAHVAPLIGGEAHAVSERLRRGAVIVSMCSRFDQVRTTAGLVDAERQLHEARRANSGLESEVAMYLERVIGGDSAAGRVAT